MEMRMTGNNPAGVVFVRARGGDAYATVDKAASRLRLAVARRVGRHRSQGKRRILWRATWQRTSFL
jgi:hypothetical protein